MSRFADVVRKHRKESDGVLVASTEPCITIAQDERSNAKGRTFRIIEPDDLHTLTLTTSWCMAVLLCPGDGTQAIRDWFQREDHDPERIIFYLHAKTSPRLALKAWHEARLPLQNTWLIRDWRELHKHFGTHWNNQIYLDVHAEM